MKETIALTDHKVKFTFPVDGYRTIVPSPVTIHIGMIIGVLVYLIHVLVKWKYKNG